MRIGGRAIGALLLVAGCSHTTGGQSQPGPTSPASSPPSRSSATSVAPSAPSAAAPAPDTPVADVISWIAAGQPVDAGAYHSATRDGTTTQLGDDVAFTTPSGQASCMTDSKYSGGALACLVRLADPPARPTDAYGEWVPGWVDFDGASITVGGIHGDPGRFTNGDGPQLPSGKSLKFGDYQCRSDQTGLYCVNFAHQSAARFSDTGIQPFGCVKQITPPADIGEKFVC